MIMLKHSLRVVDKIIISLRNVVSLICPMHISDEFFTKIEAAVNTDEMISVKAAKN